MAPDTDSILSDFIDAWNAGRRPAVDDYLAQAAESERAALARDIDSFLAFAPTPDYSDATLEQIRASPEIAQLLQQSPLPALLASRRVRLELSVRQLAERLADSLGLKSEQVPKTESYLERWERDELVTARVSRKVFQALSDALRIPVEELEGAGRIGGMQGAPVFRSAAAAPAPAPAMAPKLELLADAMQQPSKRTRRDEVDELFLGGR